MLKIDDKIYKYTGIGAFLTYDVIAIKEIKNNTLFEIECMSCRDHEHCTLYIQAIKRKKGVYEFVSMTNNDDQKYWHDDFEDNYFTSLQEAKKDVYVRNIKSLEDRKEKAIERVESVQKELDKMNAIYSDLLDAMK